MRNRTFSDKAFLPHGNLFHKEPRNREEIEQVDFIEIEWCTPTYQETLELRHRLLREPLGLKLTAEELDGEHADLHYGMQDSDGNLVAVVVARQVTSKCARLRQMAVSEDVQRQGIGTALIQQTEQSLAERGFEQFQLHARETAISFYERLGYEVTGEPFVEVSLPHRKMTKDVRP